MIIVENRFRHWLGILAAIFLGMTFVVAGSNKVFTPVIEIELLEVLLIILITVELIIGILLVIGILVKLATIFSLSLIAGFIVSNIDQMILGQEECLSCFGAMGELSALQALYIDGIMLALAVVILFWYPGRFFNKRPWFW